MKFQNYLALSLVASFAVASVSHAGMLNITNENDKPLKITIQAEGDAKGGTLANSVQEIPASTPTMIKVDSALLGGMSMFTLDGETSKISFTGSCKHLTIDKDYDIHFESNATGTTCKATEVVKTMDMKSGK